MTAFLDTGFFLSIVHPQDPNSTRGNELLDEIGTKKFGILFTSDAIIAEVMSLAWIRTNGHDVILRDLVSLLWGEQKLSKILFINQAILEETRQNFIKYNKDTRTKDEFLSFVDTSSVVLCEKYKLNAIISFDSHFDRFMKRIS